MPNEVRQAADLNGFARDIAVAELALGVDAQPQPVFWEEAQPIPEDAWEEPEYKELFKTEWVFEGAKWEVLAYQFDNEEPLIKVTEGDEEDDWVIDSMEFTVAEAIQVRNRLGDAIKNVLDNV